MAWLSNPPASYAFEQLNHSLSALSTIPVSVPEALLADAKPSSTVENALRELSRAKPISKEQLVGVLDTLVDKSKAPSTTSTAPELLQSVARSPVDKVLEAEVMARAVTVLWRETLDALVDGAARIESERLWWEQTIDSKRNVGLYFLQSLPLRVAKLIPTPFPTSLDALRPLTHDLKVAKLFHQSPSRQSLATSFRTLQLPINNPLTLTRREIMRSLKVLKGARDSAAEKIGFLVSHGPQWATKADMDGEDNLEMIVLETTRLFALLGVVLDVPLPLPSPTSRFTQAITPSASPRRPTRHSTSSPPPTANKPSTPPLYAAPTSITVLPVLRDTLPQFTSNISATIATHRRPSRLVRYWIPLLLAPSLYRYASQTARENKDWVRAQLQNAGETVKGWMIGWVWEPLEGVFNTLKGGGEGLGVAPQTVQSDQASLERMILDLGRDHYHLEGEALEHLKNQIAQGDMEPVLKVYEGEMRSPLKNAIVGSLIRTLLIQVQKTKYDLSLSLLSLDHLLRSQQLTFAFVGLAPSLLTLYGLGGWLQRVWTGEKRGKGRRQGYAQGLRDIERLLITCGKAEKDMSDRDKGLLVLAVSRMRVWSGGLRRSSQAAFLEDLRLLEDAAIVRNDKLRVMQRIWLCWGPDGRRSFVA